MKIKVYPDLSGAAPKWATYYAVDDDSYDGAEDSGTRNDVGRGETEQEAIDDLLRLLDQIPEVDAPESDPPK